MCKLHYNQYTITTSSGTTITVSLSSSSFIPSQLVESPERSSEPTTSVLLVVLIVVCVLLGCVALMIVIAISMLCYLTKRGNSKDHEGSSKPPTVDPISYTGNGGLNGFYTANGHPDQNGLVEGTAARCNDTKHLEKQQTVSFSNPVYEISNSVRSPPSVTAQSSLEPKILPPSSHSSMEPHSSLIVHPPSFAPESSLEPHPSKVPRPPSLSPPKQLPTVFSPTPPIFSDEDDNDSRKGRRSYYAKPDMSKKRSRSTESSSPEKDTSPPSYMNNITNPSAVDEVVYDCPMLQQQPNKLHNHQQLQKQSIIEGVEQQTFPSDYSTVVAYEDPSVVNTKPNTRAQQSVPATTEPSYDDPWENLPGAIRRSRESTRSHSYQPAGVNVPIHATNINNNNTSLMFDDPAYDIICENH